MLLSEAEFWERMARRVSEEFAGLAGPALRYLWCDGLIPESYALDGARPTIGGRAWIGDVGNARDQELWTFELVVGHFAASRDPIPWATLLPHHDATHWLGVDHAAKRLCIDPGGEGSAGEVPERVLKVEETCRREYTTACHPGTKRLETS